MSDRRADFPAGSIGQRWWRTVTQWSKQAILVRSRAKHRLVDHR